MAIKGAGLCTGGDDADSRSVVGEDGRARHAILDKPISFLEPQPARVFVRLDASAPPTIEREQPGGAFPCDFADPKRRGGLRQGIIGIGLLGSSCRSGQPSTAISATGSAKRHSAQT